jgi:hypothetical protein
MALADGQILMDMLYEWERLDSLAYAEFVQQDGTIRVASHGLFHQPIDVKQYPQLQWLKKNKPDMLIDLSVLRARLEKGVYYRGGGDMCSGDNACCSNPRNVSETCACLCHKQPKDFLADGIWMCECAFRLAYPLSSVAYKYARKMLQYIRSTEHMWEDHVANMEFRAFEMEKLCERTAKITKMVQEGEMDIPPPPPKQRTYRSDRKPSPRPNPATAAFKELQKLTEARFVELPAKMKTEDELKTMEMKKSIQLFADRNRIAKMVMEKFNLDQKTKLLDLLFELKSASYVQSPDNDLNMEVEIDVMKFTQEEVDLIKKTFSSSFYEEPKKLMKKTILKKTTPV